MQQGRAGLLDGMLAFRAPDSRVFLPLSELFGGIGFAIDVDPVQGTASGYYLDEANTFALDVNQGTIFSAGKALELDADQVLAGDMDIYVELDTLNKWFGNVSFVFNDSFMYVEVVSDPPLPIVRQSLRSKQKASLVASQSIGGGDKGLPAAVVGYRLVRPPMVDLDTRFDWSSSGERDAELYLRAVHDFAYMGAQWYAAFNDRGQAPDVRLNLSRKDPEGELFGPLKLTAVQLGDIALGGMPLVTRGITGRGLRMTNRRRNLVTGTTTELRGELLPGWDVELYRNNVLIGYSDEAVKGEYVFADIQLQAGLNDLMLVMYGPQGQRREHHEVVRIGANQPAPGQWYMEWGSVQQEVDAVEEVLQEQETFASADKGAVAHEGRWVYGLTPGTTLVLSGVALGYQGEGRRYAGVGGNFSWLGMGVTLDLVQDEQRRRAFSGQWVGELGSTGLLFQFQKFDPLFSSPVSRDGGELRTTQELRVNRVLRFPVPDGGAWPVNSYLAVERKDYLNGTEEVDAALGMAGNAFGAHVTHTLSGSYAHQDGQWLTDDFDGRLDIATRLDSLRVRTGFRYGLRPVRELREIALSANAPVVDDNYWLSFDLLHSVGGDDYLSTGLNWAGDYGSYSARVSHDGTTGETRLTLDVRTALDWSSGGFLPRVTRSAITTQGLVKAHVFVDRDGDGRQSQGDEPVSGVRLSPGRMNMRTDNEGNLFIAGISEFVPTDVTLNEGSLPDPFLRPQLGGYTVTVRPGASVELDFPLVWVSDIEGKVLVTEPQVNQHGEPVGPRTRGLGNVRVRVLTPEGKPVTEGRSEYDGFFAITNIPPGRYRVTVDPAQAERFDLIEIEPLEVVIEDDTAVLNGLELRLRTTRTRQVSQRGAGPSGAAD